MKVIGITGGVGAGKSTVLKYLQEAYGAVIIEADLVGHQVMEPGERAYEEIQKEFGREILKADGTIDRKILGEIVFSDKKRLDKLNQIVHPKVKYQIQEQIEKEKNAGTKILVIEAALLLEENYQQFCQEVWYIHTDDQIRCSRLKENRGYSEEKIAQIMCSQRSPEEFRKECQAEIDNSGSWEAMRSAVDRQMNQ